MASAADNTTTDLDLSTLHITSFNPAICASLYNKIIARAAALLPSMHTDIQSNCLLSDTPNATFSHPSFPNDPLEQHISPSLAEFLRQSNRVNPHPDSHIFPNTRPIDPGAFFIFDGWGFDDDESNVVCLMRDTYSRGGGLFFDQTSELARYANYPEWSKVSDGGWMPLEGILRRWLKMFEVGKVKRDAGEGEDHVDVEAEGYNGYMQLSFNGACEFDLTQTLRTWARLLEVIIDRLPDGAVEGVYDGQTTGLVMENELRDDLPHGVKLFLMHARQPPRLASGNTVRIAPVINVPSASTFTAPTTISGSRCQLLLPVSTSSTGDPSGVYICQDDWFPDMVAFMTPARNGTLAISTLFASVNPNNGRRMCCAWSGARPIRFVDYLQTWTRLIEEGVWTVGRDGVEGDFALLMRTGKEEGRLRWQDVDI